MAFYNRSVNPNFSTPYMQQFQATGGGGGGGGGGSLPMAGAGGGGGLEINPGLLELFKNSGQPDQTQTAAQTGQAGNPLLNMTTPIQNAAQSGIDWQALLAGLGGGAA